MSGVDEPQAASGEGQPAGTGGQLPGTEGAPTGGEGPPTVPPPLTPTGIVDPGTGPGWAHVSAAPEQPKKSGRGLVALFAATVAAALGAIFVKFVLPLLIVGVAGDFLGVAFGGPYMQLPGDVRSGYENRIKAALGDSFLEQSDDAQTAQILRLIKAGMPRLDDGLILTNFQLTAKALSAVDDTSCAGVARAIFVGTEPPVEAATKMIETLSVPELQQWFDIRIAAVEAEVRGSPAQVVVGDAEVEPLYQVLFTTMTEADLDTISSLAAGSTVEDAAICSAVRGLHNAVLGMSGSDAMLFARYDISP